LARVLNVEACRIRLTGIFVTESSVGRVRVIGLCCVA